MTLREDRVRLPSGHVIEEFHVTDYPDWSAVIAVTETGDVVLVEQYRYGVGRMSVEFPAGAVDPGEAPEATARRELLEETGYAAERFHYLGALTAEPSRATNRGHFFVAEGARRVAEPAAEETEDLRVLLRPAAAVLQMADDGAFVHGLHAAATFWAHRRGLLIGEPRMPAPRLAPFPIQPALSMTDRPSDPTSGRRDDTPADVHKEHKTIIVSVNTEQDDEEAQMRHVQAQAGRGWRVVQTVPISGGGAGPGGNSEHFMRLQVTLERSIDADNVIVTDEEE